MSLFPVLSLLSNSYFVSSAKLLILGTVVETGRRLCQWIFERFRIQYSITAQFSQGDPTYEWILHFLNDQKVWRHAREFRVTEKNSSRKWGINSDAHTSTKHESVEYVPTYDRPQLFRWKGYWLEITRAKSQNDLPGIYPGLHFSSGAETVSITVYTLDMSVLSAIVEEARQRYIEVSRPHIIIHLADTHNFNYNLIWGNVKRQLRRPSNSIILPEGVLDSLRQDAKEFMETETWYTERGIPHRRGYLLYGPPGSGKSSTIYALAGEMGMEIYSLSLASSDTDDAFLQRAASSIPKNSISLIEDIDCALPSREENDEEQDRMNGKKAPRSSVTLSTLLNVLDGVGSEEGRLFFTTTNHIDRLDPALIRPGRIDLKVSYHLATKRQAAALFMHFFPQNFSIPLTDPHCDEFSAKDQGNHSMHTIKELSESFASQVPSHEFSVAELQGYLLRYKNQAEQAACGFAVWAEEERLYKCQQKEKEDKRKGIEKEKKEL